MKRCPNCGQTFGDDCDFCLDDGSRLIVQGSTQPTIISTLPGAGRQGPALGPGKGSQYLVWGVIVLISITAAGFAIAYFMGKNNDLLSANTATNQVSTSPDKTGIGTENPANANANIAAPSESDGIPQITAKTIKEKNSRLKTDISARYPQISGSASADNFNSTSEQLVRKHISDFKRDLDCYAEDRFCELSIDHKAALVTNRIVSVQFWASFDTGGAHPNSYSFVLNYDVNRRQVLSLNELFSGSNFLGTISDYCISHLKNQVSDYETLRDGASPKSDNYKNWLITNSGLQITFDAYQVASYAEGPKTVLVPYSVLKNQIAPSGPISHLMK
jgi:hypothetical protein